MTKHTETAGLSYPTPVARILAELAGFRGDDWMRLASDLTDLAGGAYGEEARDWLHAEITDTHEKADDWTKPAPAPKLMHDIAEGLALDDRQRMRLAMVFSYGSEEGPSPNPADAPHTDEEIRRNVEAGTAALRNTAFGEVVCELLEKRGIEVSPFRCGKTAEEAGLDGWAFINRMADTDNDELYGLSGLEDRLDLEEGEMWDIARAYAYEVRPGERVAPDKATRGRNAARRVNPR